MAMDAEKRKALEAAGWRFGDAADFLAMTDEERQILNACIEAALAVRRQREAVKLSQNELAGRINAPAYWPRGDANLGTFSLRPCGWGEEGCPCCAHPLSQSRACWKPAAQK